MREKATVATRKAVISLVGAALVLVGTVMLVTPGPGMLFVLAGITLLAKEYSWPRRLLDWARSKFHTMDKREER